MWYPDHIILCCGAFLVSGYKKCWLSVSCLLTITAASFCFEWPLWFELLFSGPCFMSNDIVTKLPSCHWIIERFKGSIAFGVRYTALFRPVLPLCVFPVFAKFSESSFKKKKKKIVQKEREKIVQKEREREKKAWSLWVTCHVGDVNCGAAGWGVKRGQQNGGVWNTRPHHRPVHLCSRQPVCVAQHLPCQRWGVCG